MNEPPHSLSKTITDLCNNHASIEDGLFCLQVFKSDPRSSTVSDFLTILKIAVDSAVKDANKTRNFLVGISQNNTVTKSVVKVCISAYDGAMLEWHGMIMDFKDGSATYDGLLALDKLSNCDKTLADTKISEPEISSRIKVAYAYGRLNVAVSQAADKH